MIAGNTTAISSGHMEHIRFYSGVQAEQPSTIVGFSDGVVSVAGDSMVNTFLTDNAHEVRTLSDEETATIVGSLSLHHIDITPPLSDSTLEELVPILLATPEARNLPNGIMAIDNRHGVIPADRSQVSGPILGSVF